MRFFHEQFYHLEGHRYIGFEHFHHSALVSDDGWKIVRPGLHAGWELYNLNVDRTEKHDVSAENPEILQRMIDEYEAWAKRCMVEPWPGQRQIVL